jgi:hypothetical protein
VSYYVFLSHKSFGLSDRNVAISARVYFIHVLTSSLCDVRFVEALLDPKIWVMTTFAATA